MTATSYHFSFHVEGCLALLAAISGDRRDKEWAQMVHDFEEAKSNGLTLVTSCPTPIEESPGHWVCPGHPKEGEGE